MKYIEILDKKAKCPQCFFEGRIIPYDQVSYEGTLCTSEWSPHIDTINQEVVIASAYRPKVDFENSPKYRTASERIRSHLRAINTAKVDNRVCLGDMIPKRFYLDLCSAKGEAIERVLREQSRPPCYDQLVKIEKIIHDISSRDITLDLKKVKSAKQVSIIKEGLTKVNYNSQGSVTGRLATKRGSFPVMSLATADRSFVVPTNDLLVEFDFNAAELRVLLALGGHPQPDGDVHEWNRTNVCRNLTTRKEAKERFFSWLYNPNAVDHMLERYYDKGLFEGFYGDSSITTPFGRRIEVDRRRALNYLIQSTSSDVTLEQAYEIRGLLSERKSFIKFLLHDSIVLDIAQEDLGIMKDLYFAFRETRYGKFNVNVRSGKDFFNMNEVKWKI